MGRKNGQDRGRYEKPIGSGTWWIRYHDFRGREHREKIGPKSLARQAYAKRKTQVREELFFPKAVGRQKSTLIGDFIQEYLEESKTYRRSFETSKSTAKRFTKLFGKLHWTNSRWPT